MPIIEVIYKGPLGVSEEMFTLSLMLFLESP